MIRFADLEIGMPLRVVCPSLGSFAQPGDVVTVKRVGERIEVANSAGARFSFNCVRGAMRFSRIPVGENVANS